MKVFVTGATGVLGRSATVALIAEGHEVSGLARTETKAALLRALGARPLSARLFDEDSLAAAFAGCDAVCNLATHMPVGLAGLRSRAWKANDRLRIEGSKAVALAAKAAGVRRLVQESVSLLYADGGDSWIDEDSPLSVTRAVDPAAIAETNAASFDGKPSAHVILRFGMVIGDDPLTQWLLAQARLGRPVGVGDPMGWAHVVHSADAGAAVVAALCAPGGVYNVGAEPVRRDALTRGFAQAAGRPVGFVPRLLVRAAGERLEPLTRSHRISAARLHEATGWKPERDAFDQTWLTPTSPS